MMVPGVVDVVQIPSGVAVLATDTWSAMGGRDVLRVDLGHEHGGAALHARDPRGLSQARGRAGARGRAPWRCRRCACARLRRCWRPSSPSPIWRTRRWSRSMPLMELRPDGAEIWAGCQVAQRSTPILRPRCLASRPEQIKINTLLGGGSFGRRGNPHGDWVGGAGGDRQGDRRPAPVHLVWTREDDIKGGYYRPLTLHRVKVGLDAAGSSRAGSTRSSASRSSSARRSRRSWPRTGSTAAASRGSPTRPTKSRTSWSTFTMRQSAVPVLWWRSVGHSHTAHVVETMLDELARRAGKDPVAFRRELLAKHPRDARRAEPGRARRPAGGGRWPKGRGRGIAYHRVRHAAWRWWRR